MIQLLIFILAEILAFIFVGSLIGFFVAFLLIVLSSAIGFFLLRFVGFSANSINAQRVGGMLDMGAMQKMVKSPFLLALGLLLILPGFITTLLGLLCLIPYVRKTLMNTLYRSLMRKMMANQGFNMNFTKKKSPKYSKAANDVHRTLEGEFWDKQKKPPDQSSVDSDR